MKKYRIPIKNGWITFDKGSNPSQELINALEKAGNLAMNHIIELSKLKIGDKVLKRNSSDDQPEWKEITVNETYLELIKEFPEDYRIP